MDKHQKEVLMQKMSFIHEYSKEEIARAFARNETVFIHPVMLDFPIQVYLDSMEKGGGIAPIYFRGETPGEHPDKPFEVEGEFSFNPTEENGRSGFLSVKKDVWGSTPNGQREEFNELFSHQRPTKFIRGREAG